MMFLIGTLSVFLLAKLLLPAVIVYINHFNDCFYHTAYRVLSFVEREETLSETIGAIIFIMILLQLWKWV